MASELRQIEGEIVIKNGPHLLRDYVLQFFSSGI